MFMLYGKNDKTLSKMTSQEQKISLIVIGIMLLGVIAYGIYYFFKNRNDK